MTVVAAFPTTVFTSMLGMNGIAASIITGILMVMPVPDLCGRMVPAVIIGVVVIIVLGFKRDLSTLLGRDLCIEVPQVLLVVVTVPGF